MTELDWQEPQRRCFGLMLASDDCLLATLLNANERPQQFALPLLHGLSGWRVLLDTAELHGDGVCVDPIPLSARSLVLLQAGCAQSSS